MHETVISATTQLMGDPRLAPGDLTVSRIAKAADVHPTSIYRRWGSREHLLSESIDRLIKVDQNVIDTGDLETDLVEFATWLRAFLRTPVGRTLAYLTTTKPTPEDFTERKEFWSTRFSQVVALIERAKGRGELPTAVDPVLLLTAITAPVHLDAVTHSVQPAISITSLVRLVLHGAMGRAAPAES